MYLDSWYNLSLDFSNKELFTGIFFVFAIFQSFQEFQPSSTISPLEHWYWYLLIPDKTEILWKGLFSYRNSVLVFGISYTMTVNILERFMFVTQFCVQPLPLRKLRKLSSPERKKFPSTVLLNCTSFVPHGYKKQIQIYRHTDSEKNWQYQCGQLFLV